MERVKSKALTGALILAAIPAAWRMPASGAG